MTAIQKRYRPVMVTWDHLEEIWIVEEPDGNQVWVDTQTRARHEGMQVAKNADLEIGGSFKQVQLPGVAVWSMQGRFRTFDENVPWFEKALYRREKPRLQKAHRPLSVLPNGSMWSVNSGSGKFMRPFKTKREAYEFAQEFVEDNDRPGISVYDASSEYQRYDEYDPYYSNRMWTGK